MIKRLLKSIFSICKTVATETIENRRDIIGLPTDPYRELPEFDDPFAEWDTQDAGEGQEEEAEEDNVEEEEDDDDSE
jgi:hypothetical protein